MSLALPLVTAEGGRDKYLARSKHPQLWFSTVHNTEQKKAVQIALSDFVGMLVFHKGNFQKRALG